MSEETTAAFYAEYGVRKPVLMVITPRRCRGCGHAWEVTPSKAMLVLLIALLGGTFLVATAAAIGLPILFFSDPDGAPIKALLSAVLAGGVAFGSFFSVRYYWRKLWRGQASG
jgi:hypothetical protein